VVLLTLISYLLSGGLGLALPGPEGGSDNVHLRPDNALRLSKGFFTALALLPFLRARMRAHGDAMVWLGAGMAAGLALVAAAVLVERALFTGIFDFTTDYRVVGTFSGMNIGGGYIGAYLAMALPFLLVFMVRPRALSIVAMFGIAISAGYALVVTFARTAYAAGLLSMLTAGLGWAWAGRRGRMATFALLALPTLVVLLVGGIVMSAFSSGFMAGRFRQVVPDLADREANWTGGMALLDNSLATVLFGMGFGTYPRIVLVSKPDERFPTNFVIKQDGGYRFLSLHAGLPTYFGQKGSGATRPAISAVCRAAVARREGRTGSFTLREAAPLFGQLPRNDVPPPHSWDLGRFRCGNLKRRTGQGRDTRMAQTAGRIGPV
jgi:hypothetical protein